MGWNSAMEEWNDGMLRRKPKSRFGGNGIMEWWNNGKMEERKIGRLECWRIERWKIGDPIVMGVALCTWLLAHCSTLFAFCSLLSALCAMP